MRFMSLSQGILKLQFYGLLKFCELYFFLCITQNALQNRQKNTYFLLYFIIIVFDWHGLRQVVFHRVEISHREVVNLQLVQCYKFYSRKKKIVRCLQPKNKSCGCLFK